MIEVGMNIFRPLAMVVVLVTFCGVTLAHAGQGNDRLATVTTWMYQLQNLNDTEASKVLAATGYDMLVIEPGNTFAEDAYDTQALIGELRHKPDGSPRILLAYIDIGQAEDYRAYWGKEWRAPKGERPGNPDFIIINDPDGWSGNYPVAYWRQEWKTLWLGEHGIITTLARLGFDGVYLDWVEGYDEESVVKVAQEEGRDAEMEMVLFIEEIGSIGRAVNASFMVVAQNAPYLIDSFPKRYATAIDAVAMEDTWFNGEGDAQWDDSKAGDLHTHHEDDYETPARLIQYRKYLDLGIPVFSIDYCVSKDNAARVYNEARAAGLIPLVTRVSLSRMTETPPE